MIGYSSLRKFIIPVVACSALALVGCGGGDDDDDGGEATPTATPVPPMDDYFRITDMVLLDSDSGVDLDGDGTIDNNIDAALDGISTSLSTSIEQALLDNGIPEECPPDEPTCVSVDSIMSVVNSLLDSVFSTESLSDALSQPIEDGDVHYILEFAESGANVELEWFKGEFDNVGYRTTDSLGVQDGALDSAGDGTFGPGDLTLTFQFTYTDATTGEENTIDIFLTLNDAITEIDGYNSEVLNDIIFGGAISIEELLDLVEEVLNRLQSAIDDIPGQGDPITLDIDKILSALDESLSVYADIDLDGDGVNEGFSIGIEGSAQHIEPLE